MYKKLYKDIIDNAKQEIRVKNKEIYYESHHIVPDFMFKNRKRKGSAGHLDGDPNSVDNLIMLTFQEHLMCHFYLYEILKGTRYEYQAGSALQFFFVKATGNHKRQIELSEVDKAFLDEMAHLRQIGIQSISNARRGKMPVVNAITKESIGSVAIDHPRVLSGEWIHHSTGKKNPNSGRDMRGSCNTNYKEMTTDHVTRIYKCLGNSLVDIDYVSKTIFVTNVKTEFTEFKKISFKWIENRYGKLENLVEQYNKIHCAAIKYSPYYRSVAQRKLLSNASATHKWVTDGINNIRIIGEELQEYLKNNPAYKNGRTV